jgi:nucleoside-diphosphate-sugar epimerase
MDVLVIGGTGFIGRHVVRRLAGGGHHVTVFHRGTTQADLPGGVASIHGDRDRLRDAADELRAADPDVVVDVIPYTEAHARADLDVFADVASRIVAVSSSDVYRNYDGWRGESNHDPDPVPLDEDAPVRETLFPYRGAEIDFAYAHDYDKLLVERTLLDGPVDATVVRLPKVYGPGDAQQTFVDVLQRMHRGDDVVRVSEDRAGWRWTHGYVENVAAAIAHLAEHPGAANQIVNAGERPTPSVADRRRCMKRAVEWDGRVEVVPTEALPADERVPGRFDYELATDTSRLHDELGFAPPASFQAAIRQTLSFAVSS